MLKFLPFIAIAILVLGGLGYWRFFASKPAANTSLVDQTPIEVPKTLPQASLDDRVKALEDLLSKVVVQVNSLTKASGQTSDSSLSSKVDSLEASVTELKARVSALEGGGSTTAQTSSSKSPSYIPLGSGGETSSQDWTSLTTFQANIDPSQYLGYKNVQLQVNMRLNQPGGSIYARLYNLTDNSATSSEVSTGATSSTLVTSGGFSLSTGSKTYVLQAKSSSGTQGFIDTASLKINF